MKHIFFSILTALAFYQCKPAAPAPKNILHCYVRFDAPAHKIKAEASVQDGSTKKTIECPGGLLFQSTEMKIMPIRGLTYTAEYPAKYLPEQVFEWKNKKMQKGLFTLELPSIDSFFFDTPVLSVKTPANLRWIGKPLSKGETLVFIWDNTAEGKTVPMEVSTTLAAPLIEIPAAKLAQLGPGDWSLYLVRKKLSKSETDDFFIESTAEYYTDVVSVKVRQ